MNKLKVHHFKMRQVNLAREISEELGDVKYSIVLIQHYGSNNLSDFDENQIIIPENFCKGRKSRIIVSMYFATDYDEKIINKMMHRWFKVIIGEGWFNITYSVNMNSI